MQDDTIRVGRRVVLHLPPVVGRVRSIIGKGTWDEPLCLEVQSELGLIFVSLDWAVMESDDG